MLDWLEEFMRPWFVVGPAPSQTRVSVIDVRVDANLFRSWLRAACATGSEVVCFTMDHTEARWPLARVGGGAEFAFDETFGIALGVRTDDREARVVDVLAETERPHARMALMRVLRELASCHGLSLGEVPIHGAAVAEGEGITLFVGEKGAGKSSLLVHALMHEGTRYVSNDRVFVRLGSGAPTAHGMPTIVSLQEGVLALSENLRDEVSSGAWHYSSTVAEARANRVMRKVAEGIGLRWPPGLSPAQLCALLRVEPIAGGTLTRIVFPEIYPTQGSKPRFSLQRLSREQAGARLLESGLLSGGRSATFVSGIPPPERSKLEATVRELGASVPCLSCVLGPDAYASPSVWRAIREFPE